jgi:hypothetical protein
MNPLETIENDPRLTSILKGLTSMWHFPEEFLGIVVYHADDFDIALEVVECYSEHDLELEEALYEAMSIKDFKENCCDSEYLDSELCKKLIKQSE